MALLTRCSIAYGTGKCDTPKRSVACRGEARRCRTRAATTGSRSTDSSARIRQSLLACQEYSSDSACQKRHLDGQANGGTGLLTSYVPGDGGPAGFYERL